MEIARKRTLTDPQRSLVGFHHLFHQLQRLLMARTCIERRVSGCSSCTPSLIHHGDPGGVHQKWTTPPGVVYPISRGVHQKRSTRYQKWSMMCVCVPSGWMGPWGKEKCRIRRHPRGRLQPVVPLALGECSSAWCNDLLWKQGIVRLKFALGYGKSAWYDDFLGVEDAVRAPRFQP